MSDGLDELDRDLFHQIWKGNADGVSSTLKAGANPDCEDPGSGLHPLHLAARYGNVAIIDILTKTYNVRADVVDSRGKVPYEWAEDFDHLEAENVLIDKIINNEKIYGKQSVREARHHLALKR